MKDEGGMMNAKGKRQNAKGRSAHRAPTFPASSIVSHPASFPVRPFSGHRPLATGHSIRPLATGHSARPLATGHTVRRGIGVLEVLISIAILLTGLVGVAILIPVGKLAMTAANKSDRTGACGRAALSEIRIRNLLDATENPLHALPAARRSNVYVIDPLFFARNYLHADGDDFKSRIGDKPGVDARLGGVFLPRTTFDNVMMDAPASEDDTSVNVKKDAVERFFLWSDELIFNRPEDLTSTTLPSGGRPQALLDGTDVQSTGSFSWFLTVVPRVANYVATGSYEVSAVVCYKRALTLTRPSGASLDQAEDERVIENVNVTPSSGGMTVTDETQNILTGPPELKPGQWVFVYSPQQSEPYVDSNGNAQHDAGEVYYDCNGDGAYSVAMVYVACAHWYRVVHASYYQDDEGNDDSRLTLVGPDWHGGTTANILVVGGVTGVYTTTVWVGN